MKPPSPLDSAKVLYWAWSGDEPFGNMKRPDGAIVAEIYGFAICLLNGDLYRFSCDREWKVRNDMDFRSVQEAMNAFYPQYQSRPTHWNKFDETDIDTLLSECQKVKFFQEIGERRVIQIIIDHLKKHNCTGMSVQSTAKGIWILSIQKKDIPIANEVAKQNVE